MTKPKLTYFDAPISRGEECRLALFTAGVDFEDNRLKRDAWMALKPTTPFGSLPLLEMAGSPPLAQSNAILTLIGRRHGLHPKDDLEAARHEAVMSHVEDLRIILGQTMQMSDPEVKKATREKIARDYLPAWAGSLERQIAPEGPFFAGAQIHVVDFKILMTVRWISSGSLDHIPATAFAELPKINRVREAVEAHPKVKAWYARS